MSGKSVKGDRNGFTLVEIAITVALLGLLVMLAISSFAELREKYAIESETKNFYAAMMEARGRAMQRNRYHFVSITSTGYAAYEDVSPSPDGNGNYEDGSDNQVISATVNHVIDASNLAATGMTGVNIIFDRRGIAAGIGYVRFATTPGSSANPDYNCVTILETRLRTGKMTGGACVEK